MKKFSVALISLVLCFIMAFGAFAAVNSSPVEASSVEMLTTGEQESTKDPFEEEVSNFISENQQEVDQVTDFVTDLKSTISKVLDELDKFLRNFGVVVNQILTKVFKDGLLPF